MQRKHHLLKLNQLRYVNLHERIRIRGKDIPGRGRGLRRGIPGTFYTCVPRDRRGNLVRLLGEASRLTSVGARGRSDDKT